MTSNLKFNIIALGRLAERSDVNYRFFSYVSNILHQIRDLPVIFVVFYVFLFWINSADGQKCVKCAPTLFTRRRRRELAGEPALWIGLKTYPWLSTRR